MNALFGGQLFASLPERLHTWMYEVDGQDRVIRMEDIPQPPVGTGLPFLLCDQHTTVVAYDIESYSTARQDACLQIGDELSEVE